MGRLFLLFTLCSACTSSSHSDIAPENIEQVVVEIDYQSGAEPYVGKTGNLSSIWKLTRDNLARVYSGRKIDLPESLDAMDEINASGPFTTENLIAIAARERQQVDSPGKKSFYILFVDGKFSDENGEQDQVLGVSIGNTGIIAMFKPVIAGAGIVLFPQVERFVEQTTLIHELGHALGLVNNGIALTSSHHDHEHGAHCTNEDCVMYYLNAGVADLRDFIRRYQETGETILFDDACLADTDAHF